MKPERSLQFDPPQVITVRRKTPITGANARERVVDARGTWSNCDLYISGPTAWAGVDVHVEIWCYAGGTKTKLLRVDISAISRDTFDTGKFGCRIGSIRGTPCDGFEVLVENSSLAELPEAEFSLVSWGTESTPEAHGELQNDTMDNVSPAIRDARLMGFNDASGFWKRVRVDASGNLLAIVGGSAAVTLGDAMPNPTTPAYGAYGLIWNGASWMRQLADTSGRTYVRMDLPEMSSITDNQADGFSLRTAARLQGYDGANWDRIHALDNRLAVVQDPEVNSELAYSLATEFGTSNSKVVKAAAGLLLSFVCTNYSAQMRYAQFQNAAAPVDGGTALLSFPMQPGESIRVGRDWFGPNGMYFSAGISFGFSEDVDTLDMPNDTNEFHLHVTYK